jgi:hypothetical protein
MLVAVPSDAAYQNGLARSGRAFPNTILFEVLNADIFLRLSRGTSRSRINILINTMPQHCYQQPVRRQPFRTGK